MDFGHFKGLDTSVQMVSVLLSWHGIIYRYDENSSSILVGYLFGKVSLFSIAKLIGNPLKLDSSTATLATPSVVRICVELDLRHLDPDKIWIHNGASRFWQRFEYENLPNYCDNCYRLSILSTACRLLKEKLQMDDHQEINQAQIWVPKSQTNESH